MNAPEKPYDEGVARAKMSFGSPEVAAQHGPVNVTRPLVPNRAKFDALLNGIFDRAQFTNEGPLVQRLAADIREWLGLDQVQLVSSGASALGLALDVVQATGSVVTTPFTFAASPHSIALKGLRPIFADIDPDTLCLDPVAAEAAMEAETSAILGTHVFGGPCDVEAFAEIGKRRQVAIVYDGAHAFGTRIAGRSVFEWGDANALSFHATKIFHTFEGGGVVTRTATADERVRISKAHGIDGMEVPMIGPNAKLSELHAACGLVLLPLIHDEICRRSEVHRRYRDALHSTKIQFFKPATAEWNFAYCPILLEDEDKVLKVQNALSNEGIGARRYFCPALNTLPYYSQKSCPNAEDVARRVLCLPFGSWLDQCVSDRICDIVLRTVR
ncbi:MAG: DegT/DnrJ/EryC1/StrS family aminotransferase [Pontixanthobacter sp.]